MHLTFVVLQTMMKFLKWFVKAGEILGNHWLAAAVMNKAG